MCVVGGCGNYSYCNLELDAKETPGYRIQDDACVNRFTARLPFPFPIFKSCRTTRTILTSPRRSSELKFSSPEEGEEDEDDEEATRATDRENVRR